MIAPANETLWYRRYWAIVGAAFLMGLLGGGYFVVKWAIVSAYMQIRILETGGVIAMR